MNAKELESLIAASRSGDMNSFARIVQRFQDMAYGYAYAILGDFHLAQDVAQEAFVEAYYNLSKLQDAAAFPGWFRQIVRYRCSRFLRSKNITAMPLNQASDLPSVAPDPHKVTEDKELKAVITQAIRSLSQLLREVTTTPKPPVISNRHWQNKNNIPLGTPAVRRPRGITARQKNLSVPQCCLLRSVFIPLHLLS